MVGVVTVLLQPTDWPAVSVSSWVKWDAVVGAPVGLPVRPSNPTRVAAVVVAGLAIETVIALVFGASALNERNWSLPAVVVEVM